MLPNDVQVLTVDDVITDCVFDAEYKLVFILCQSGKVYIYHYDMSLLKWMLIEELELSTAHCQLVGSACCFDSRIYWQTFTERSSHKVSINSTPYHVKIGCEVDDVVNVTFSPLVQILDGCFPCDLVAFRSTLVLALSRYEKTRGIVIAISPVRIVISDLVCGVVGCYDHLLAPVQFPSVCISVIASLQSSERAKLSIGSVLCNGHRLVMISSAGIVWEWIAESNTFSKLNLSIPTELLDYRTIICKDNLVFMNKDNQVIKYINTNSNVLSEMEADLDGVVVQSWCYGRGEMTRDVLILCSDGRVTLLSQVLSADMPGLSSERLPDNLPTGSLYEPPTSVLSLKANLHSIIRETTPKDSHSSQLLQLLDRDEDSAAETSFTLELSQKLEDGHGRSLDVSMFNASIVITTDTVQSLLETVTPDNLGQRMATLAHYADVARKTCLSAFTQHLLGTYSESEGCRRWTKFFTLNYHAVGGSPPLISLFLYLIWQVQPHSIVDSVLMVGCKYKECLSLPVAPTTIVDSLLDMIQLQTPSGRTLENNYLLPYYHLSILSSSEAIMVQVISMLKETGREQCAVNEFYGGASDIQKHLLTQYRDSQGITTK